MPIKIRTSKFMYKLNNSAFITQNHLFTKPQKSSLPLGSGNWQEK